jgi:hypothetical protein
MTSREENALNNDLEHDPEKWKPVLRKDHARMKNNAPRLFQQS